MIFFMAGTSDARELGLVLRQHGYPLVASVASDHAAVSLQEAGIQVRAGRLDVANMCGILLSIGAKILVDASHPFAEEAHRTVMEAAKTCNIPYMRFERAAKEFRDRPGVIMVDSYEQAAEVAAERKGSIMLTTGSKTLQIFTKRLLGDPEIRLVARMLPRSDNMEKCEQLGLEQKNIVAIQGPFSKELNRTLYQHFGTTLMITKESGAAGSIDEKVEAALKMGIDVVVIARPKIPYGNRFTTFDEVLAGVKKYTEGMGS